jgi:AraC-like DNA-binding protein
MLADVHILHQAEFYRITDFVCHCDRCSVSETEYNESLSISFIRKGFFEYQTFRREDEVHTGRILVSKPGYDHVIRHIEGQPDLTTILEFTRDFFMTIQSEFETAAFFFLNNDIHSLLLQSNPRLDYLHQHIWNSLQQKSSELQLDEMIVDLLENVIGIMTNSKTILPISNSLKKFHLGTVEKARQYLLENFHHDISLLQLSAHCLVSPFHFSRIFKSIMNISPHQYLTGLRLTHGKLLLNTTSQSVADISYACNFSSPEHFSSAYKKHFKINPASERQ